MNKVIVYIALVGIIVTSCADNGKKAKTEDAAKVEAVSTSAVVYKTLKNGSSLEWRASHLGGVQKRHGKVFFKEAAFSVVDNALTNANVVIDLKTLTVENFPVEAPEKGKLTGHLKSADFFNIEKYPTSKFELTKVEPSSGDYNTKLTGNLTILDVTKSISFLANVEVSENEVSIKSEDFAINRTDWGLSYNTEGTEGVPVDYLISNDVGFTIDVTAIK